MDKCDPSAYWSNSKTCGAQCQRTHIAMPAGWTLVPYSADVVSNIAAKHNFHTHVLVFGNGKAYGTKSYSSGRLFGWGGYALSFLATATRLPSATPRS